MIDKKFISLNFLKKEIYTGSFQGMRYRLSKETQDDITMLKATIWPEPYCFEVTADEKKQSMTFGFSEEGKAEAVDWLNKQYGEQRQLWDSVNPYK